MRLRRQQIGAVASFAEYLLLVPVLASTVGVAWFFFTRHYLPQPFVMDVNDTFMDWFNTALYAHRSGAFNVWKAVYPPLSFVFLRIFSIGRCYADPFAARNCDWVGTATILACYVIACGVAVLIFWRRNRSCAVQRGLAFSLGLPMLFAVERGNLILVCLIPFMLVYGEVLKSRWASAIAIATTINFKPYLIVQALALAVKRDWRGLELAGIVTIALYLTTLAIFGSGTPLEIYANTQSFVSVVNDQFWQFAYYSTSYNNLLPIAKSSFETLNFVASGTVDTVARLIPVLIFATQLSALAGLAAGWLQPGSVSLARNVALLTGVYLCTQSPGGYAIAFLIFTVFLEDDYRPGQVVALTAAYILSISWEQIIATVLDTNAVSWLSGLNAHVKFGLGIGQFVRPGLVILIVWSLALDSITLSILGHRATRPSLGFMPQEEARLA